MNIHSMDDDIRKSNKLSSIKDTSGIASNIRSNTLQAINILVTKFLADVKNSSNPITIHDTKELKDTITVFQQIQDTTNATNKKTPEINTNAINFISNQTKEPRTKIGALNGTNNKIKELKSKDVKQLMKNEESTLNSHNQRNM